MGRLLDQLFIALILLGFSGISNVAYAANESPQTFTLDGQLFQRGTSNPLLDAAAKIKIQIISPDGTCLLYEEQQTVNTLTTEGRFTVHVGSSTGAAKRTVNDPGRTIAQIFQNIASITANNVPGQTCAGGAYTPAPSEVRYFRITVTPSGTNTADVLTPDLAIDSVPNAMIAQSVQGLERTGILQVNNSGSTALSQANLEAAFTGAAYTNLQAILGGSFIRTDSSGAALPSYAATPAGAANGDIWFDTTTSQIKYQTSGGVQTIGAAGAGSISSLTMGSSLSVNGSVAGTISSGSGTIDLSNTGVGAGTYTKVTVDTKGRVTAGTVSLVEGDIPNLTSAGKVSGNTITSGTISGSAAVNTTGNIITTGTVSGLTVQATNLRIYNGANYVQMTAPALGGNVNLTLPTTDGNANEFLKTDGNGVLSWATASVTSVDVTTALGYTPLNAAATFSGDVTGTYSTTSVEKIRGKSVTAATTSGQMMIYNGTAWVNSVVSGDATLAYDGILTLNKVPVAKGGTNATSFGNNRIIASNGTGTALQDFTCSLNQVISFDASGNATCANVSSLSGAILNGGNTTGAAISVGTNDNHALQVKTNNTIAMTISENGNVGIGTTTPGSRLDLRPAAAGDVLRVFNTLGTVAAAFSVPAGGHGRLAISSGGGMRRIDLDAGANSGLVLSDNGGVAQTSLSSNTGTNNYFLNNVGIGISSPSTALTVSGAITAQGMSSAPAVSAANTGRIYYDYSANKFKVSQNGAAYVDLVASGGGGTGGIISLGGQAGSAQTLAISVDNSVATPTITSASDTHTWKIPMASNSGTTAGLLNKTDYDSFVAKLGTTTSFAGDVSGTYNATSVDKIKGKSITAGSVSGQIMIYNGTAWVNSVVSGDATLAHDGMLTLNKVPVSKGGTNATSFGNNRLIASNGTGTALQDFTCSLNQVVTFNGSGEATCGSVAAISGAIINGGNTTGADISIGSNDTKAVHFKANNSIAMTISQNGSVGFGVTDPGAPVDINSASLPITSTNGILAVSSNDAFGIDKGGTLSFGGTYWAGTGLVSFGIIGGFKENSTSGNDAGYLAFATKSNGVAAAERMRISSTGNIGIGTTAPSSALDISGAMTARGMSSAPSVSAANTGRIYYDYSANKFKVSQNGAAYVDLVASGGGGTGGIISLGGQAGAAQTLAISVDNSVATPTITSASDTHTWKIPMASNTGTTAGLLNKTDYDMFAAKLGTTTIFAGDVSGAYNSTVVQKIQGKAVTAASVSGQIMIYDGTAWSNNLVSGDGTLATNGTFTLNKVPVTKGGTNATSFGNNRIIASNGTGSALVDFTCSLNQVISFDASGNAACANVGSLFGGIVNGGNTTGNDISIGTNDNYSLKLKANNTIAVVISDSGYVNVGGNNTWGMAALQVANSNSWSVSTPAQLLMWQFKNPGGAPQIVGNWGGAGMWGMGTVNTTEKRLRIGAVDGNVTNVPLAWNGTQDLILETGLLNVTNGGSSYFNGQLGVGVTSPSTSIDISGAFTAQGMSSAPSVSNANTGRIYYDFSANKFKVSQNGSAYTDLVGGGGGGSGFANGGNAFGSNASLGTTDNRPLAIITNNTTAMTISQGGYVGIGTTSPTEKLEVSGNIKATELILSSDRNLKKNIRPLENSLDKILSLAGVRYQWRCEEYPERNFDQREHMGLIAQEVAAIYPDLVHGKDGNMAVDYTGLIAPMIEAIKEQHSQVQSLKDEVSKLKDINARQETMLQLLMKRVEKLEQR